MEWTTWPSFQNICRCLVELIVKLTEVVVNRCGTEHTHATTLALLELEPLCLYDYAEALNEEDAAEYGEKQFLVDDDCTDANYTADSQRASIAHEDLALYHRKPIIAPTKAQRNTTNSSEWGIYIISK